MKKYPVVTEGGEVYLVKIKDSGFLVGYYKVKVYEKIKLFGKEFISPFSSWQGTFSISDWEYSLVKIAKEAVERVEMEKTRDALIEHAHEEFEKWDGMVEDK